MPSGVPSASTDAEFAPDAPSVGNRIPHTGVERGMGMPPSARVAVPANSRRVLATRCRRDRPAIPIRPLRVMAESSPPTSASLDPTPERLQLEIAAATRGDEAAWRRIVEWYTPRVFGLVRSQCGDVELAEEITQSTFCTLAEKLERYVENGRFEAWLFRIAVNRLRDEMRRRRRHAVPIESTTLAAIGPAMEDATPVDRARLHELLARALGELGPSDREVIELRHIGGMSFRQMADHLDEPLGTLLARHHRALRKLRGALGPEVAAELEDL